MHCCDCADTTVSRTSSNPPADSFQPPHSVAAPPAPTVIVTPTLPQGDPYLPVGHELSPAVVDLGDSATLRPTPGAREKDGWKGEMAFRLLMLLRAPSKSCSSPLKLPFPLFLSHPLSSSLPFFLFHFSHIYTPCELASTPYRGNLPPSLPNMVVAIQRRFIVRVRSDV